MPYCNMCGAKLPDDARFCISCGAPVAPPITEREKRRMERELSLGRRALLYFMGFLFLAILFLWTDLMFDFELDWAHWPVMFCGFIIALAFVLAET